jgi:NAD(P)-dependent dehydrogenase (short-subunit alcohol dehydrogenase family)
LAQSLPYTQSIVVQHVDVSSAEEIERAASEIPEGILRRLSHVVGNAGIVNGKDVLSLTNAEVERCMSVNFNQHMCVFRF